MNLKDSLKENNSIALNQKASSWQEAIEICMSPLLKSGAVNEEYVSAIIERTKELGPFYIIAPGLAMPHERPEKGVNKDSFSFITLETPVIFDDGQEVDILIGLAASTTDIHTGEAIPQIVMLFDDESAFEKIRNAKTKEEIYELIDNSNK